MLSMARICNFLVHYTLRLISRNLCGGLPLTARLYHVPAKEPGLGWCPYLRLCFQHWGHCSSLTQSFRTCLLPPPLRLPEVEPHMELSAPSDPYRPGTAHFDSPVGEGSASGRTLHSGPKDLTRDRPHPTRRSSTVTPRKNA